MRITSKLVLAASVAIAMSSCVAKKKFVDLQSQLSKANSDLVACGDEVQNYKDKWNNAQADLENQRKQLATEQKNAADRLADMKSQIADLQKQRDQQMQTVGDLTILSKKASDNIDKTLTQMREKDQYINLIQAAKTKADSMNLALAINLRGSIGQDLNDDDVEIKVDKTVVMINLSDKMLYRSGSYQITPKANEVLGKIAAIIKSRPELEVMVEGYTDNVSINTECIQDNWDLSVKRSTSVIRALQNKFGVDPDKLIAAGRGEYNALTSNDTSEGRSINRRTRIILMPKIDQFYDLLNPDLSK